jgi:hypothetical protein
MTAPVETPPEPTAPPVEPPAVPKPETEELGDAGKKALAAERDARKAAEKELAKYRKAEQDKAEADKSEAEKRAAAEQRAVAAELRATRLEVAHEKGLTPAQAKRLAGATKEELEADADEILRDFPVTPAATGPKLPKPDPSQGPKGETRTRAKSLTEAIAAARKPATG